MVCYRRAHDALELHSMAEDDPGLLTELEAEATALEDVYTKHEFSLALGGKHDADSAIFSIFAGAGGTEAQDRAADAPADVPALGRTQGLQD